MTSSVSSPSSDLPSTSSAEEAFRPAFVEIARRSEANRSLDRSEAVSHFQLSGGGGGRLATEKHLASDQAYFLVSVGSSVLAPRPLDQTRPSLRVYGAFPAREHAAEHAQIVRSLDAACSLIVLPRGEWFAVPQTERERDDPEANAALVKRRLEEEAAKEGEEEETFRRAVEEKVERPPPPCCLREDDGVEAREEEEEAEEEVYGPPPRLRAGAEVRSQNSVVLSVLPDRGGRGECLFRLHACFDTSAEAGEWAKNSESRRSVRNDLLVFPTCEWAYPNSSSSQTGKTSYRLPELQKIMDAAEKNPELVRSYKEWMADREKFEEEKRREKEDSKKEEEEKREEE